jgi:hypothetical protein
MRPTLHRLSGGALFFGITACGGSVCPTAPAPSLPVTAHETWRCRGGGHVVVVSGTGLPAEVAASGVVLDCHLVPLGRGLP